MAKTDLKFDYAEEGTYGVVVVKWGQNKYRLILHKEMAKEIVRRCEAEPKLREALEKIAGADICKECFAKIDGDAIDRCKEVAEQALEEKPET